MAANNEKLKRAKKAKKDEFYTQFDDINNEVQAYVNYNSDVFKNKTVLMPCDDPWESNFVKFFCLKFNQYGIKKLIATSYSGSPVANQQLSLFSDSTENHAYKIEITAADTKDINGDGVFNLDDVKLLLEREGRKLRTGRHSKILSYLSGDNDRKYPIGDFRSKEVTALRDEADVIITNPPFSLFREFVHWVQPEKRQFLIIGNQNAITYKEIFPLIKNNKIWLGKPFKSNVGYFASPYNDIATAGTHKKGLIRISGVMWFTNLDYDLRHHVLKLMTIKKNLKYGHKKIKENGYQHYDNYDAIEVPYTDAIPADYAGVMGVPITFLDKYNPEQFKILGADEAEGKGFSNGIFIKGSNYKQAYADGHKIYKRIFIQALHPEKEGNN